MCEKIIGAKNLVMAEGISVLGYVQTYGTSILHDQVFYSY